MNVAFRREAGGREWRRPLKKETLQSPSPMEHEEGGRGGRGRKTYFLPDLSFPPERGEAEEGVESVKMCTLWVYRRDTYLLLLREDPANMTSHTFGIDSAAGSPLRT